MVLFTTGGMIDRVRYEVTIVTFLAEKKQLKQEELYLASFRYNRKQLSCKTWQREMKGGLGHLCISHHG